MYILRSDSDKLHKHGTCTTVEIPTTIRSNSAATIINLLLHWTLHSKFFRLIAGSWKSCHGLQYHKLASCICVREIDYDKCVVLEGFSEPIMKYEIV
jgi:hypothetical protein